MNTPVDIPLFGVVADPPPLLRARCRTPWERAAEIVADDRAEATR